jgi:hypothetical protein
VGLIKDKSVQYIHNLGYHTIRCHTVHTYKKIKIDSQYHLCFGYDILVNIKGESSCLDYDLLKLYDLNGVSYVNPIISIIDYLYLLIGILDVLSFFILIINLLINQFICF